MYLSACSCPGPSGKERRGDWRWPGTDGAGAGTMGERARRRWTDRDCLGRGTWRHGPAHWSPGREDGRPTQKWTPRAGDVDSKTGLDVPSHTPLRRAVCVCASALCVRAHTRTGSLCLLLCGVSECVPMSRFGASGRRGHTGRVCLRGVSLCVSCCACLHTHGRLPGCLRAGQVVFLWDV